jgi:DNA-binding response OmpR family regulator
MARIAVVEDEPTLRADMVEFLQSCGHDVVGCHDGVHLTKHLADHAVDVFILDINLPGENGFTIAKRLRQSFDISIGIIMLSARSKSMDRVVGLEIGADAYLVKPVDFREVEAQIHAIERRLVSAASVPVSPVVPAVSADWIYNPVDWTLTAASGDSIKLTATERTFISQLADHPGDPVSRDTILTALGKKRWDPTDRSVDALVHRLQAKAEKQLGERLPISAVHGLGYAFSAKLEIE